MSKSKLGTVEAIALILSVLAPFTVISLSQTLINELKSSILLNIFYVGTICLFMVFLICTLFKNFPGLDIIDISKFLGGNVLKNIIGFAFIIYFVITSSMLLRNFCEGLKIVYYPYTNILYIILIFIITITFANDLGFNSTIKTTTIIFPILLVSILLIFIGNLDNFSFQRILPILGNGYKSTFILGLSNIGTFSGIVYMYLLPPLLNEPKKYKKICILSIILSVLFIFMCVATLLFLFSIYISTDEIMPLFSVSKYIEFGNFFQRFEALFLLIWTISFCCYLSISLKFSTYIFAKLYTLSDTSQMISIFSIITFAIALFPSSYYISHFFETYIYRILSISIMILGLFILFLAYIKKRMVKKFE